MRDDKEGSSILFLLQNPTWKPVRTKFSPIFATSRMQRMLFLITESSNDLSNYIKTTAIKEEATETRDLMLKYTTDVISSCAFGINADCFNNDKVLFRELSLAMFGDGIWRKIEMFSYYFAPILVKLFKMKFLEPNATKHLCKIVKNAIKEREKSGNYNRGDVIDQIIKIKSETKFDTSQIAGFETTASTITFTLLEISLNQAIQDRLVKEIQAVSIKHGGITYENIQEMTYLDMVLKETLRKYPIVPFVDRRCKKDYQIPGTDIIIDNGIPVFIPLVGLHYNPNHFPNPEKFDPERFCSKNAINITPYNYMPFGVGPRHCLGERFAKMAAKIAIITIIKEFQVEPYSTTEIPIKLDVRGFLICPQDGVYLRYRERS